MTRTFKTAWFHKQARKAKISDAQLCNAVAQMDLGQMADLGGGVYKKRLDENRHRSIILAHFGQFWIYEFLFAKKDRDNIDASELMTFRTLVKAYKGLTSTQLQQLLDEGDFLEICHDA
jgi:hypothetical protein